MPPPSLAGNKTAQALRTIALKLPGVEEGVACEGTVIEKRTIKIGGRAFLFLGPKDAMLKLGPSVPAAAALTEKEPARYRAGSGGWTKLMLDQGPMPMAMLGKWVRESYGLMAGVGATPKRKPRATGGAATAKAAAKTSRSRPTWSRR